nr:unnamed protein product [Digitaria exilis]
MVAPPQHPPEHKKNPPTHHEQIDRLPANKASEPAPRTEEEPTAEGHRTRAALTRKATAVRQTRRRRLVEEQKALLRREPKWREQRAAAASKSRSVGAAEAVGAVRRGVVR